MKMFVDSLYSFATDSSIRGFFPLLEGKVLEFYIDLEEFEEGQEFVGDCSIIGFEEFIQGEVEEAISLYKECYAKAEKFDVNPFINKNEMDPIMDKSAFDGVFKLKKLNDKEVLVEKTKLTIDLFEGVCDGEMDVKLRGHIKEEA